MILKGRQNHGIGCLTLTTMMTLTFVFDMRNSSSIRYRPRVRLERFVSIRPLMEKRVVFRSRCEDSLALWLLSSDG